MSYLKCFVACHLFGQERFYNAQTFNWSRASVVDLVAKFAAKATGLSYKSAIQAGFEDSTTDQATRISFKVILDAICVAFYFYLLYNKITLTRDIFTLKGI